MKSHQIVTVVALHIPNLCLHHLNASLVHSIPTAIALSFPMVNNPLEDNLLYQSGMPTCTHLAGRLNKPYCTRLPTCFSPTSKHTILSPYAQIRSAATIFTVYDTPEEPVAVIALPVCSCRRDAAFDVVIDVGEMDDHVALAIRVILSAVPGNQDGCGPSRGVDVFPAARVVVVGTLAGAEDLGEGTGQQAEGNGGICELHADFSRDDALARRRSDVTQ